MEYKVKATGIYDIFEVYKREIEYGERINAYESEEDKIKYKRVYSGNLLECYAYIKLKEGRYL